MIELLLDGQFAMSIGPVLTSKLYILPKHILESLVLDHIRIEGCGLAIDTEGIIEQLSLNETNTIRQKFDSS